MGIWFTIDKVYADYEKKVWLKIKLCMDHEFPDKLGFLERKEWILKVGYLAFRK